MEGEGWLLNIQTADMVTKLLVEPIQKQRVGKHPPIPLTVGVQEKSQKQRERKPTRDPRKTRKGLRVQREPGLHFC